MSKGKLLCDFEQCSGWIRDLACDRSRNKVYVATESELWSFALPEKKLLGWINRADLCRIKGVGEEYSDLLECAGVDSVPELSHRNPENLHASMITVNEKKNLVRATPSVTKVQDWVRQAKKLPLRRLLSYSSSSRERRKRRLPIPVSSSVKESLSRLSSARRIRTITPTRASNSAELNGLHM